MGSPKRDGVSRDEILRHAEALFFVDDLEHPVIRNEDMHHLLDVLRPRVGQHFALSDGIGSWRKAVITSLPRSQRRSRGAVVASEEFLFDLGAIYSVSAGEQVELTVGFAMPKGDRLDLVVQKLTELGIDRIVPLITKRTVVRLDDKDRQRRRDHLNRVAREACSQSRRLNLPLVFEPQTLEQFLRAAPEHTVFAEPGGVTFDATIRCVIIGPEGGFDQDELPEHAQSVGLGPNILRVETAAIAAATLLSALRSGVIGLH